MVDGESSAGKLEGNQVKKRVGAFIIPFLFPFRNR